MAHHGKKTFLLRVDPRLHDALRRWAEDELRSLNAQVEVVLRQSLMEEGRLSNQSVPEVESNPEEPERDRD